MNFDRLRAPTEDAGVLIEPPPARWAELIEQNRAPTSEHQLTLCGRDLVTLRDDTRGQMRGADRAPVIACGHQPAFVHPGVWAKHYVVHYFSRHAGFGGLDLVVDNDAPTSWALHVPHVTHTGVVEVLDVPFAALPAGSPYELAPALDADQVRAAGEALRTALGERFRDAAIGDYLAGLYDAAGDLVSQHLAGRLRVDGPLGADLPEFRVSRCVGGAFVADLLLNAGRFAGAYNQALASYRRRENIREPHRPLPDLGRDADRVETAFWTYPVKGETRTRRRLWTRRRADAIECYGGAERIGTLSADQLAREPEETLASLHPFGIRPRALTLTLWARLLACDLFVHGIGGAKYDRITDDIFRSYYRYPPPAYACVTATLRLPLPRFGATAEDLLRARQAQRDLLQNPQRHLDDLSPDILENYRRLVAASEALRQARAPRLERRDVYLSLRALRAELLDRHPERVAVSAGRTDQLAAQLRSNTLALSREYFYALQPVERLRLLTGRLRETLEPARLPR